MKHKKRILVAPLNWGLGHATRCIPIINALIANNFEPVIGSDGAALALLQHEFPQLKSVELPAYNITYTKNPRWLKFKMLLAYPSLSKTITQERQKIKALVNTLQLDGIISDNRFGIHSTKIPSIYITHQLKVLSGLTTKLSSYWHQKQISKFDACWVPDTNASNNLSGDLCRHHTIKIPITYIGSLSRFTKKQLDKKYDVLILLSGPEPQRQLLEDLLLKEFKSYTGTILFVRGIVENQMTTNKTNNLTIVNFLTSSALNDALNMSDLVISRSGYTTIMDLACLGKMAFFIPTPGQNEQVYLAKRLGEKLMIPSCSQNDFKLDKLHEIDAYSGFSSFNNPIDFKELFDVFLR